MHHVTTLNIASIVEHHARLSPGHPAVVWGSMTLSYGELDAAANRVAGGLVAMGIQAGDHVALSCPNLPYFPMVYFGVAKAGAVVVPLNVLFKPREIAYHLQDSDARACFCFEGTPELPMAQMAAEGRQAAAACERFIVMPRDAQATSTTVAGATTLAQAMAGQPATFPTHPTRPDDTAAMLYTSGTTGQPKGAELSHLNILMNTVACSDLLNPFWDSTVGAVNVVLITLPLFHATAQVAQMCAVLYCGGTIVLLPRFEPGTVLETMRRERVNAWTGVPTMYWTLLQYAKANGIDTRPVAEHLRVCTSGGAPMPVEVMKEFEAVFGVRVLEGYGLSETSPVATFNHAQRPSKPGTVGQPLFGVDVMCVDDLDRPVPAGQPGEVVIRGHNVMKGYYKRPDATAEAMKNGWFHTGDIGLLDEEGYLSIIDRKKDMILRGGFSVYPRELEEVMMTHPAVSLVAVIGVPDDRLGEEVKACVVRKPGATVTEAELLDWCKAQFAAYKYPRAIEFRDELPVSATGKILKRALREQHAGRP